MCRGGGYEGYSEGEGGEVDGNGGVGVPRVCWGRGAVMTMKEQRVAGSE